MKESSSLSGVSFFYLMKLIIELYRYCNYLSLDVACGAMICATFFSRILNIQLRPYGLASLGLTVWIIYTADHLLDARKIKHEASSQRHRFHQRNFQPLCLALTIAIALDLVLALFVRKPIIDWGIALSLVVLLYLFFQQQLVLFKELAVSLLYSAGVLLPAMSLTSMAISYGEIILIIFFVTTAFINLILFSWYDWKNDLTDKHASLVTYMGRTSTKRILIFLFVVQLTFFAVLILNSNYKGETVTLFVMNGALFALFLLPEKFKTQDYYRLIGDAVFFFPLPYIFLSENQYGI